MECVIASGLRVRCRPLPRPQVTIGPTGGLGGELATLEDAARFVGLLRSWRQGPHWDFAAELLLRVAETGKRIDVEAAAAQMERALRVEGWL